MKCEACNGLQYVITITGADRYVTWVRCTRCD